MQKILRCFAIALFALGCVPALAHAQDSRGVERTKSSSADDTESGDDTKATGQLENAKRKWLFQAWASEEYRFRHSSHVEYPVIEGAAEDGDSREADHDLRLFLSGHLSEDRDQFAADVSLGLWYDLGGSRDPRADPTAMGSVVDHESPEKFHDSYDVYSLYAEYKGRGILGLARGGRQTSKYGVPTTFDGATLELRAVPSYLDIAIYGGRTVHFFDLDDSTFENWLAAAVAVVRPLPSLRLEVEYRFMKEDTALNKDVLDHAYGLTAWYRMTDAIWLKGYLRGRDADFSNIGLDTRFTSAELGLGVEASVEAQLVRLGDINENGNPFFAILGESLPFIRMQANLWKEFATKAGVYGVHLGWKGRLLTEDEPTAFNRNYGRAYLLCQATDIGIPGLFANAVVEYHHPLSRFDIAQETRFSVGGSAGYERKKLKGEIGSFYDKYKYNYYHNIEEKQDVRTYYGEFRYDPFKWLSLRLRYEYERLDRDLHTVALRLSQTY